MNKNPFVPRLNCNGLLSKCGVAIVTVLILFFFFYLVFLLPLDNHVGFDLDRISLYI